jgi:Tfp pilus assembly protein PilF
MQMAQRRAEQFGRIPAYYLRIGNDLWPKGWAEHAWRAFTLAKYGFLKNLALNPNLGSAHGDFAWFLVTCPDPRFREAARALTHAQKAVALDPTDADHASLLGMAHYRAGDWPAAVESLEKAVVRPSVRFSSHARLFLAMAHRQLGHPIEARRWYDQVVNEIKQDSSTEELRLLRIEAAVLLGIRENAQQ